MTEQGVRTAAPASTPKDVLARMAEIATLTTPDVIEFCDSPQEKWDRLTILMVENGIFAKLNEKKRPSSFLAHSKPSNVARVESRTFICSEKEGDASPVNHWADPKEMRTVLKEKFASSMIGHTLYVIPFPMGPLGGPISQLNVGITDSPYIVCNIHIMAHIGIAAMGLIAEGKPWVPIVHSVGVPLTEGAVDGNWPCNDEKYIARFPETNEIWSFNSGYGGNALLGKKCFALRIAPTMARHDGWMAEHILILRLTRQETSQRFHVTIALPSAYGKTNPAMLRPTIPSYNVGTVGDNIAWMRPDPDGRLYAINPETGFFGIAPDTSYDTNPMTMDTTHANSIFTNAALTDDGDVWWGDIGGEVPAHLIDQLGKDWTPESGERATHSNSHFAVPASQCPIICPGWEAPQGVPVDTTLFSGRHATSVPLVAEQYEAAHSIFIGASVVSEVIATAADVRAGSLRHDPLAILPFCGHHIADCWGRWLKIQAEVDNKFPKIYQVNWFHKDEDSKFMWPSYGDNSCILGWIVRRAAGGVEAIDGVTGRYPEFGDFNLDSLDIDEAVWAKLFETDLNAWTAEMDGAREYFAQFGGKLPVAITEQLAKFCTRIEAARA